MSTVDLNARFRSMGTNRDDPGDDRAAGPAVLRALFPAAPAPPGAARGGLRASVVAAHIAALAAGTAVMLARVPGHPAWDTIFYEDFEVYLPDALNHPGQLLLPYEGYVQLLPRLVAQLAALLPLRLAAVVFALAGALTAAACAVVVFHASAGHIRSAGLRALAGASVILLPVAELEIVDSTVDAMWYLLLALFWVALWRPRTRTGAATAAAVAFLAASAQPLTLLFAPLLAARAVVLRRPRDHAVTLGWLAGLAVQALAVTAASGGLGQSRARTAQPGPVRGVLSFYAHGVVQSAFGWHIGQWLQSVAGRDGAVVIAGIVLAAAFGWALRAGPAGPRAFIAASLLTGSAFTVISSGLSYHIANVGMLTAEHQEECSRYTTLAIFLAGCSAIVAVDALARRRAAGPRGRQAWPRRLAPVLALVVVLSAGWVTDFRITTMRSAAPRWAPMLAGWERYCAPDPARRIGIVASDGRLRFIPCARVRD